MNEATIYIMVNDALEICERLGFDLQWLQDGGGWQVDTGRTTEICTTVSELHYYLNGFRDGMSFVR